MQSTGHKRRKGRKGVMSSQKLPTVGPNMKCRLKLLKLNRIKDWLLMEEEFIKRRQIIDKRHYTTETELEKQIQALEEMRTGCQHMKTPMRVMTLEEIISADKVIVSESVGNDWYIPVLSFVDKEQLELKCEVLVRYAEHHPLAVVGVIHEIDPLVGAMRMETTPKESYADIGGLELEIQELKESVELPLTHPEYYEDMGIKPPKGVILYGPPGTGKTLLAKAVANQTSATFLHVVGSALIQKYLGDGPKLIRELFRTAEDWAPSIIFIDEVDAIGAKRYNADSSGEREIQRTMLELLNQLDGFDGKGDIKVIMATNRIDLLDAALIRPGRIDRKLEITLPNEKTKQKIFNIHTQSMSLAKDVNFEHLITIGDELSGADIKAICTEAGLLALRDRRNKVTKQDFEKSKRNVLYRKHERTGEELYN